MHQKFGHQHFLLFYFFLFAIMFSMINLTWFGTATILIDVDGEKLLFDPFFRMNDKLERPEL